ncbi:MAG: beta-galactosidase trimerization domain-containing protein [Elusimicrobiota bacterium]
MKLIPISFIFLSLLFSTASAAKHGFPILTQVEDNTIILDGKIRPEEWQAASVFTGFKSHIASKTPLAIHTTAYAVYDSTNLYFGLICADEDTSKIICKTTARDGRVWGDDSIELMIDPSNGKKCAYHIIINTRGIIYDEQIIAGGKDITWDSGAEIKTVIAKSLWYMELRIPFTSMNTTPQPGEVYNLFIGRNYPRAGKAVTNWPGIIGQVMDMEKYGEVLLTGKNKDIDIPAIYSRGAVLRGLTQPVEYNNFRISFPESGSNNFSCAVKIVDTTGNTIFLSSKTADTQNNKGEALKLFYPADIDGGTEAVFSYTSGITSYESRLPIKSPTPRVFQVYDELYTELLSTNTVGLAQNGAIYWFHDTSPALPPMCMQYGMDYIYADSFDILKNNKLLPISQSAALRGIRDTLKEKGLKCLLYPSPKRVPLNVPRLPDSAGTSNLSPEGLESYYSDLEKTLKENEDVIWGIYSGDEEIEQAITRLIKYFEVMKDTYAFIREVNTEIMNKYGAGKYGLPINIKDPARQRWVATYRWILDKYFVRQQRVLDIVKSIAPETKIVSWDPISTHKPFNFGYWTKYFDVMTTQLYPSLNSSRCEFGFLTKLVADLTGKETWPCCHVENYASTFTVEEIREYFSQVYRNGGTGIHLYLKDTIGVVAKTGGTYTLRFGSPVQNEVVMQTAQRAAEINKLQFPNTCDTAVLYSCDAYQSQGVTFSSEVEWIYTFLGPVCRAWFKFIDDNQITRGDINLNSYKTIIVPYAKYERREVVQKIQDYVRSGGTLVVFDPEAFMYDPLGDDTQIDYTQLFGCKLGNKLPGVNTETVNFKVFNNKELSVNERGYELLPNDNNTQTVAVYKNNSAAVITHSFGKGTVWMFGFNPLTQKNITDTAWKELFNLLCAKVGITTGHDIWRFKLPKYTLPQHLPPDGVCLTNNYIFWDSNKPAFTNTSKYTPGGMYKYSVTPDLIKDTTIQQKDGWLTFSDGKLTNRRAAPTAGDVDAGITKLNDWIVSWSTPVPVIEIEYRFPKTFEVNKVVLYYQGKIDELEVLAKNSSSPAGWNSAGQVTVDNTFTNYSRDVLKKTITFPAVMTDSCKLRVVTGKDVILKLSESEVWTK